jgi:hypothetical protein
MGFELDELWGAAIRGREIVIFPELLLAGRINRIYVR